MLYVPIINRSETSNAVITGGKALIFSEDGKTLTAKLSDGTYQQISGNLQEQQDTRTAPEVEVSGRIRYVFTNPVTGITLKAFAVSGGSSIKAPDETELQFTAAAGFTLTLPSGMYLSAGRGIASGYEEGASYILNIRFGVAVIARIYPDGNLPEEDAAITSLETRVTALESAVGSAETDLSGIVGTED